MGCGFTQMTHMYYHLNQNLHGKIRLIGNFNETRCMAVQPAVHAQNSPFFVFN